MAVVRPLIPDAATGTPKMPAAGDTLDAALLTPVVGAALGTTGAVALDFAALNNTYQTVALTGNITFTTANLAAGRAVTLLISAAATRTFTFPAGWLWLGNGAPANVAAGKAGALTLVSSTAADGGVYATWSVTA